MSAQRASFQRSASAATARARDAAAERAAPSSTGRAPRVVLLTGNALATNPRAVKEADALARAGCDVEVLGAWLTPTAKALDQPLVASERFRFTPVIDLGDASVAAAARGFLVKLPWRLARRARERIGIESRWLLGLAVDAMWREAARRDADLYIAHSEAALLVARQLSRRGAAIGVDMEDWFSEDLLPADRAHRPTATLCRLEREVLRTAAHATCPSSAMAAALARRYGCAPPTVVRNAFAWSDRATLDREARDRRARRVPSIHWYSQTLGFGRGLEELLSALPRLQHDAEIHLRGTPAPGFEDWMRASVPAGWRQRVHVHPQVPPANLLSRIAEHDIGFAGEMKYCASRDLTITNKILHYLVGGLAVVASDTAGQREVAALAPAAVSLYPSGDAAALGAALNALLGSRKALRAARAAALAAARDTLCWEREEAALIAAVMAALARHRAGMTSCAA